MNTTKHLALIMTVLCALPYVAFAQDAGGGVGTSGGADDTPTLASLLPRHLTIHDARLYDNSLGTPTLAVGTTWFFGRRTVYAKVIERHTTFDIENLDTPSLGVVEKFTGRFGKRAAPAEKRHWERAESTRIESVTWENESLSSKQISARFANIQDTLTRLARWDQIEQVGEIIHVVRLQEVLLSNYEGASRFESDLRAHLYAEYLEIIKEAKELIDEDQNCKDLSPSGDSPGFARLMEHVRRWKFGTPGFFTRIEKRYGWNFSGATQEHAQSTRANLLVFVQDSIEPWCNPEGASARAGRRAPLILDERHDDDSEL